MYSKKDEVRIGVAFERILTLFLGIFGKMTPFK